jgi:hypothetical protein
VIPDPRPTWYTNTINAATARSESKYRKWRRMVGFGVMAWPAAGASVFAEMCVAVTAALGREGIGARRDVNQSRLGTARARGRGNLGCCGSFM